ncbi:DegT/DnrJ/EryC1/StrS family aminotransferase [Bradyrhizobium sp. ORS 111]|uniref:DegT/DnrJ/EryC1/StrS family aminotransferase n=1 Tax=Bradyrhizobium sp. ORS 111 TaxID=1685958 RepID=UPI00388DACEE
MRPLIPLYQPDLSGKERQYVLECIDTAWISSRGDFKARFENAFADYVGVPYAVSVNNGTTALHLALHCLGIGPGDEVIVPTLTYIASVNTIKQTGAIPVFAEVNHGDWELDPADIRRRVTSKTKAVMAVHLYGAVCDMHTIGEIARQHNLMVIEDCAEALGSTFAGQHVGNFGDVACFSFYGNKTLTTGEGGMVVTRKASLAERLRLVCNHGQSPTRRYWHIELGFNYRMTNICAALGLAQIERLPATVTRKRAVAQRYRQALADSRVTMQQLHSEACSGEWLMSVLLPADVDRDCTMEALAGAGIETRPVFACAHEMPMYYREQHFPIAEEISRRGISLPSFPALTNDEITYIARRLTQLLLRNRAVEVIAEG